MVRFGRVLRYSLASLDRNGDLIDHPTAPADARNERATGIVKRHGPAPIPPMTQRPRTSDPTRYSPPGEGVRAPIRRFGTLVKVRAEDTDGRYSVLEHALEPETLAMPMHRHRAEMKTLYALEGSLTVQIGAEVFIAMPGASLVVPAGTMHTMWNETERRVRFMSIVAPGGLERYFEEVAAVVPVRGKPDIEAVFAASARHGIELDMLSLFDIIERHHVQLA